MDEVQEVQPLQGKRKASSNQKTLASVGFTAPYFSLEALDDKINEVHGKRDQPLVIDFWASWCGQEHLGMGW